MSAGTADDDADVPVAATLVLVRDGAAGAEVLLIRRPDTGSFAGAWVFPGGKLDDGDRAGAAAEDDAARRAAVRETAEETGVTVDAASLVPLSRWSPPADVPLRIRTWFFVAVFGGGELSLQADEAVAARWVRPADALAEHGSGALTLYPPTWVTLHGLSSPADAAATVAAARLAGLRVFETRMRPGSDGTLLVWREDAEYEGADAAASSRHRLDISRLPWVYTPPR